MKNLKTRLVILISILMVCQLTLIFTAVGKAQNLLHRFNFVNDTQLPATEYLNIIDMYHDTFRGLVYETLYSLQRGQKNEAVKLYESSKETRQKMSDLLGKLAALELSTETKALTKKTSEDADLYSMSAMKVIGLALQGNKNATEQAIKEYNERFEDMEKKFSLLNETITQEASKSTNEGKDIVSTTIEVSIVSVVISLLGSFFVFNWIRKSFEQIARSCSNITSTILGFTHDLNSENTHIRESTYKQAEAVQESVSALAEMSSMIGKTGESVKSTVTTAEKARRMSDDGRQIMDKMVNRLQAIQQTNVKLQGIQKIIEDIHSKTNVINDIVFKTQLLSFNASIEAARAGQHGRGFAVVAAEVGNLAEMSGKSAQEIASLLLDSKERVKETISEIQSRVLDGQSVGNEAVENFSQITNSIDEINGQMKSINEATQQQEVGVTQANAAMKNLDYGSQVNIDVCNRIILKSDHLKNENLKLEGNILELELLVNGKKFDHKTESKKTSLQNKQPLNTETSLESIANQIETKYSSLNQSEKLKAAHQETESLTDNDFKKAI